MGKYGFMKTAVILSHQSPVWFGDSCSNYTKHSLSSHLVRNAAEKQQVFLNLMKILKEKSVIGSFFHHSVKTHYLILCTDNNRTQYNL